MAKPQNTPTPRLIGVALLSGVLGIFFLIHSLASPGGRLDTHSLASPGGRLQTGMTVQSWWTGRWTRDVKPDKELAAIKESGTRWVRIIAHWSLLEPSKGQFDQAQFAALDEQVRQLRAANVNVLVVGSPGTPFWASSPDCRAVAASYIRCKPQNMQDYADFMNYTAARLSPLGVHAYELWNEQDLPNGYWQPYPKKPDGKPDPAMAAAEYVQLLRAAYPAVKRADPRATVLLGGLVQNNYQYLNAVYMAGGEPYFDVVSNHPYPQEPPQHCRMLSDGSKWVHSLCGIEELRKVMVANGDGAKAIWVTEIGFAACSCTDGSYNVTEAQQAEFVAKTYKRLETYSYVTVAFWFSLRDLRPAGNLTYVGNLGILQNDYSRTPAFGAFQTVAALNPRPPGPDNVISLVAGILACSVAILLLSALYHRAWCAKRKTVPTN